MPLLKKIHHTGIICTTNQQSKTFYTKVTALEIIREVCRQQRDSYKLDLALRGEYILKLFFFPDPPARPSRPEAASLQHLAFALENIKETVIVLQQKRVAVEPVRVDEFTGKAFTFIAGPGWSSHRVLRSVDGCFFVLRSLCIQYLSGFSTFRLFNHLHAAIICYWP